jgi:hypothetical protein
MPSSDLADKYFSRRHPGYDLRYTQNGREALRLALAEVVLKKEDVVTIVTTTQNRYISSFVTGEVEKFCAWNREVSDHTRVIIIIHEFGVVHRGVGKLKEVGVPIIEDCAYSFFSGNEHGLAGLTGDFVVYSFPKMFPLQEGGLLAAKRPVTSGTTVASASARQHYRNVLSHYLPEEGAIIAKRRRNYAYLAERMAMRGYAVRFILADNEVPGAFMFRCDGLDLDRLKEHVTRHGIQCSVFYGENSFFIPVHQALDMDDLDYFVFVLDLFVSKAVQ